VELPTAAAADRAEREFVRDDTRRALREIAEYSRGDEQAPDQPTLASALRDLDSSTSLLIADGHGDSPESRTAEAVTYAGYLMLGARDSDAVTGTAEEWTDLADLELPSGCRPAAPLCRRGSARGRVGGVGDPGVARAVDVLEPQLTAGQHLPGLGLGDDHVP